MNYQRGPTYAHSTPGRLPEILCATHSQRSGQHVVDRSGSAGQAGAALMTPGRNNGAARAGPHPQTETMGTAATPIARLERALAQRKNSHIFGVLDKSGTVLTRPASHAGRAGGSGRYVSDLLTVRGAAKPVKLM